MRGRPRLVAYDEEAIVVEYEAGEPIKLICTRHGLGLNRLYAILDRHHVPRRNPSATRIDRRRRRLILQDYERGLSVESIARRHQVALGTVSSVAAKAGASRGHVRCHDELVGLIVRWFIGEHLPAVDVRMIKPRQSWVDDPDMRAAVAADGDAAILGVGL